MPGLTAGGRAPRVRNENNLHVQTDKVLQLIREDAEGWEQYVPAEVAVMIKERCLFGFHCEVKK